MKYQLDTTWKEWILHNVEQGCDKDGIVKILLENDFYPQTILDEMQYHPSSIEILGLIKEKMSKQLFAPSIEIKNYQTQNLSNKKSTKIKTLVQNSISALDDIHLPFSKQIKSDKIHMYSIDDFLTHEECDKIIAKIKKQCRPSTITNPNESDQDFRTSQTCDLSHNADNFIEDLDRRIADYLGYEVERAEGIQGQYYQVGNQFKAHTDYFEPNSKEYTDFASQMGQRTWTFMIYLNDVPKGGETEFGKLGKSFTPKKGQAVTWNSMYSDGHMNPDTLHWAKPIIKGEKYVITKWFRTHGDLKNPFIPFLHKEVPSFTNIGFKKTKLPSDLYKKIHHFYTNNKPNALTESDAAIGTFIHSKEKKSPSKMIELSDELRSDIFKTVHPMLEKWSGQKLEYSAVYGIREYQHGASLDMHVDRYETHVISMIINVDQEVNEDWILYIYDHFSRIHKVILKPGEVVFYESASLAHGRPEALNGKSYANIFAHTMPINWDKKAQGLLEKLSSSRLQQRMKFTI